MKILTSADPSTKPAQLTWPGSPPNSLKSHDLSFKEFVRSSLYEPGRGYYERGSGGQDYATAPRISEVFGFGLARLVSEFVSRLGDEMFTIVDIGCGDAALLKHLISATNDEVAKRCRFMGVDRSVRPATDTFSFSRELADIPADAPLLVFSNELFDAQPFSRLVQRENGLHELFVTGEAWTEKPAGQESIAYFRNRGITLQTGQFADISLEWSTLYGEICALAPSAMIVTFDYGYPEEKLFDNRVRRFGTAAAYSRHQVSRDLLARPGQQDLSAHINFTDLIRSGEDAGYITLSFTRQAEFLLRLGITNHPLFTPAAEVETASLDDAVRMLDQREAARRLVLPDGIGEDIRVLVQAREIPMEGWSFQRSVI